VRKKTKSKRRVHKNIPFVPALPVEPFPLPAAPPPRKNGLATLIHWVFSLVIIWLVGKTLWEFKPKPEAPSPAPVSRSEPATNPAPAVNPASAANPAPVAKPASAAIQASLTPQMNVTFEFNGIKSIRGFSGWSVDGSANPNLNKSIQGSELNIADTIYKHGIGTHAPSEVVFDLGGKVKRFSCLVGPDKSGGATDHIVFKVYGDGKKLFESPGLKGILKPLPVDLNVSGVKTLTLRMDTFYPGDGWAHGDWLNIKFLKEKEEAAEE
jgi:hypothetical protein